MICQACSFAFDGPDQFRHDCCPECGEPALTDERPKPPARPITPESPSLRVSAQGEPEPACVKTGTTFDGLGDGGLPLGGVVLLTGTPGIGKSSQIARLLNRWPGTALYCAYEERSAVIATRIKSFGAMASPDIFVERETFEATEIMDRFGMAVPFVLVLDSLQTVEISDTSLRLGSIPHVLAVRQEASRLVEYHPACTVLVIGHVTKDDRVAGPRTIEHLVDCVIHMEQQGDLRMWKVSKNRLGPAYTFEAAWAATGPAPQDKCYFTDAMIREQAHACSVCGRFNCRCLACAQGGTATARSGGHTCPKEYGDNNA